jgi:hypothetical protein
MQYFNALIDLPHTMDKACDQSRFYYKEHYALDNYNVTELTGAIYYPLSIYDDAVNTALNYFGLRLLYDEIKAEARCTSSPSRTSAWTSRSTRCTAS